MTKTTPTLDEQIAAQSQRVAEAERHANVLNRSETPKQALAYERAILASLERLKVAREDAISEAAACVPTTWLDSILTGKDSIGLPATCPDIEKLLHEIKRRIEALSGGPMPRETEAGK